MTKTKAGRKRKTVIQADAQPESSQMAVANVNNSHLRSTRQRHLSNSLSTDYQQKKDLKSTPKIKSKVVSVHADKLPKRTQVAAVEFEEDGETVSMEVEGNDFASDEEND